LHFRLQGSLEGCGKASLLLVHRGTGKSLSKYTNKSCETFSGPLISQYVELQREVLAHLNNKNGNTPRSRKVEDEVVNLIVTNGATDLLERRVQLEMLAEKYPYEVLAAIMKYLNSDADGRPYVLQYR
jgi:hypothetical protein